MRTDPEFVRLSLDYSRNFATAKPNIGGAEKEHILGLCNLVEALAAMPSTADDKPVAWLYDHWQDYGPRRDVMFFQCDHMFRNTSDEYVKGVPLFTRPASARPSAGAGDGMTQAHMALRQALVAIERTGIDDNGDRWFSGDHFARCVQIADEALNADTERLASPVAPAAEGWVMDRLPVVPEGDSAPFWIACRRKSGKVYTFPAVYCNRLPLLCDDPSDGCGSGWSQRTLAEDENDAGDIEVTGWYGMEAQPDDALDKCYRPVCETGDEVIAWHAAPTYTAPSPAQPEAT